MRRNIFIIPSWYPSQMLPLSGTFVKEQSIAIAKCNPDYNVVISLRSDRDLEIKWNFRLVTSIFKGSFTKVKICQIGSNCFEVSSPAFAIQGIGRTFKDKARLIAVTERNLRIARKIFGKIDLIHAHVGYPGGYIAGIISKKYNIPYVITEHMSNFPFKSMMNNGTLIDELKYAYENCSKSISVGKSAANQIESYNFKRPVVIPNMVDEDFFKPEGHNEKREQFIYLTVGGLIQRKGHRVLLEAISMWKNKPSNVKFRIVGEGPLLSELTQLSEELNIKDEIEWKGAVSRDRIVKEFQDCDVFVLPSELESFGIVYTEALACGKPVIGTRCGGPEDIINDKNGILVDVNDSIGLSDAIQSIYENINSYKSNDIRDYFLNNFSTHAVCSRIGNLYDEVIINYPGK